MKLHMLGSMGLVTAILLGSCSSDDSSGGSSGGSEEATRIIAQARCGYLERCDPSEYLEFKDMNQCIARYQLDLSYDLSIRGVRASSELAEAIAKNLNSSCEAAWDGKPYLDWGGIFYGTLANGDECADGRQCASGYCHFADGLSWVSDCGTCEQRAAEGESCIVRLCGDGLSCTDTICERPASEGESCSDRSCKFGLRCSSDRCVTEHPRVGEACGGSSGECGQFTQCMDGICVAYPKKGEKCHGYCQGLSFCDGMDQYSNEGVCRALTMIGPGESCKDKGTVCAAGMYCDGGVCQSYLADGATCATSPDKCLYPAYCEPYSMNAKNGTCKLAQVEDEPQYPQCM